MFLRSLARLLGLAGVVSFAGCGTAGGAGAYVLDHTVEDISGNEVALSAYRGKVLLIVNTASKCGFTPQYAQLEELYKKYQEQGLVVLGFPSNDFLGQEPGTNEEIQEFCKVRYGVSFPLFAKIAVRGRDQAPLYGDLTSRKKNGPFAGGIKWNFTKFLVGRDGRVVARFGPNVKPDAPEAVAAIESALEVETE